MAQGNLPSSPAASSGTTTMTVTRDTSTTTSSTTTTTATIKSRSSTRRNRSKTPPKHLKTPVSPLRSMDHEDSISPKPNSSKHGRGRTSSRDFVHSYDGKYGAGNDDNMAGVDICRTAGRWWEDQMWLIFSAYVIVLFIVGLVVTMFMSLFEDVRISTLSGTVTNGIHFLVTLIYLHWIKGSTGWDQDDLAYMTEWEIIEATPGTTNLRYALRIVPTVLCYVACFEAGWDSKVACTCNVVIWYLTMLGKMPFMNGVRLFGINAHPVIGRDE